ncbi:hypothetical protein HK099_008211, partial [Clydaea vesicula]
NSQSSGCEIRNSGGSIYLDGCNLDRCELFNKESPIDATNCKFVDFVTAENGNASINFKGCNAGKVEAKNNDGSINVNDSSKFTTLNLKTKTGKLVIDNCTSEKTEANLKESSVNLTNNKFLEHLKVTNKGGNIKITGCESLMVECSTTEEKIAIKDCAFKVSTLLKNSNGNILLENLYSNIVDSETKNATTSICKAKLDGLKARNKNGVIEIEEITSSITVLETSYSSIKLKGDNNNFKNLSFNSNNGTFVGNCKILEEIKGCSSGGLISIERLEMGDISRVYLYDSSIIDVGLENFKGELLIENQNGVNTIKNEKMDLVFEKENGGVLKGFVNGEKKLDQKVYLRSENTAINFKC